MTAPYSPCVICLEPDVKVRGRLISCKHIFCFECISQWALNSNTCPLCKCKFRCISQLELSTGVVLSKKRVGEKSQENESEFEDLDLSIDDISQLRDSIRSKYKREILSSIQRADSSDEDFSDFIVPDHLDSDGEMDGNILNRSELIEDSFTSEHSSVPRLPTVVNAQSDRIIVSEYFIRNDQTPELSSKPVICQTGKRTKKAVTTEFDQKILENLSKYGNTGWISK